MELVNLIETLKQEVETIRVKLNARQSVVCNHVVCEDCNRSITAQNLEYDNLLSEMNTKLEILNRLESINV